MLQGPRVRLRPIERDDLKRIHELRSYVDLVMLGEDSWQPESFAKIERWFEKIQDPADPHRFAIDIDGLMVGACGLHHSNRFSGSTEFGIAITDSEYVGKGYGREALTLLLDYAFRIQNWRRVSLQALAVNQRAIRMYQACGFVHEGLLRQETFYNGQYTDVVVMGLLRSEWEARRGNNDN